MPHSTYRDELVASIDALAEQTGQFVMDTATDAARAYDEGRTRAAVKFVCRLAVAAGITTGEVAWLTSELQGAGPDADQCVAAIAAITGMSHATTSAAVVGQALADDGDGDGDATEIGAAAQALRQVADRMLELLALLGIDSPLATHPRRAARFDRTFRRGACDA